MTPPPRLRIGTRGSPLALAQAELVRAALSTAHPGLAEPGAVEIVAIVTKGDRILERPLAEIGGKGLFTEEIEQGLLERRLDVAVHSMKDLPTRLPDGLMIGAVLSREDPRDVLIGAADRIDALAHRAVVGTASLRRRAQLLARRPDLEVVTLRGNVQTRLRRVEEGRVHATILARAGLARLGLADRVGSPIPAEIMLPAVAQGAVGVECRSGDADTLALLAPIDHRPSALRVAAERALLAALDGSCRTPIAALAELDGSSLHLRALVATPDGEQIWRAARTGAAAEAEALGADAGDELRRRAGDALPLGA